MKAIIKDPVSMICLCFLTVVVFMGILAPVITPHDPLKQDVLNKFAPISSDFPLGTDHLGRCVFSRLVYGIRTSVFLAMFTMICTIFTGVLFGSLAGFFRGFIDETIMRICDIMLSFPAQVMILAIVGILGVGIENVIIANILIKWAWYARMIRGFVVNYRYQNFVLYSRTIGIPGWSIVLNHILPNTMARIIILASLDIGWVIISISTLSFLGLGIQPPIPEWGAMLSETRNVIHTRPLLMLPPGISILIIVACFNLLGDSLRDALDPKEDRQ